MPDQIASRRNPFRHGGDCGAIVRCNDVVADIYDTVANLHTSPGVWSDMVLVVDPSVSVTAHPWINAFAERTMIRVVTAATSHSGHAWNLGARALLSPWFICLEAGDLIDVDTAAALRIDWSDPKAGCAVLGDRTGVSQQVAHSDVMPASREKRNRAEFPILVSRDLWSALGGFDESLGELAESEFLSRAASQGYRCAKGFPAVRARREATVGTAQDALGLEHSAEQPRHHPADLPRLSAGDFERLSPVSTSWGFDRGTPVDRRYIQRFLDRMSHDIHGHVLEVQEPVYAQLYGHDRIERVDVVDVRPSNPSATVVTDLRCAANLESNTYDCVILTQVLQLIDDVPRVLSETFRVLKPGGVLLATMPSVSPIVTEYGDGRDFWRFTEASARLLCESIFGAASIEVYSLGNARTAAAFLYGQAAEELRPAAFEYDDLRIPLLIAVRATKRTNPTATPPAP